MQKILIVNLKLAGIKRLFVGAFIAAEKARFLVAGRRDAASSFKLNLLKPTSSRNVAQFVPGVSSAGRRISLM